MLSFLAHRSLDPLMMKDLDSEFPNTSPGLTGYATPPSAKTKGGSPVLNGGRALDYHNKIGGTPEFLGLTTTSYVSGGADANVKDLEGPSEQLDSMHSRSMAGELFLGGSGSLLLVCRGMCKKCAIQVV